MKIAVAACKLMLHAIGDNGQRYRRLPRWRGRIGSWLQGTLSVLLRAPLVPAPPARVALGFSGPRRFLRHRGPCNSTANLTARDVRIWRTYKRHNCIRRPTVPHFLISRLRDRLGLLGQRRAVATSNARDGAVPNLAKVPQLQQRSKHPPRASSNYVRRASPARTTRSGGNASHV
jgi:hypothetical protein